VENRAGISAIFFDIGGVLLDNGWDHLKRNRAAAKFGLDREEFNDRHHLTFGSYEMGKITLDEYLNRVIFYKDRPFTRAEVKEFMLQTNPTRRCWRLREG
jgi:putative hydrolase of the HAD superfamily